MNCRERQRLGVIWAKVEHLLFSPASIKEQKNWCAVFLRSLEQYWQVPTVYFPGSPFPDARLNSPLPDIRLSYDLSGWGGNPQRCSVRIIYREKALASYDIDHRYQNRESLFDSPLGNILAYYPNKGTRSRDLKTDINWVLERYLLHPCNHLHIFSELFLDLDERPGDFGDILHEVRLGLGITNPFAVLFQFRLNLVLGKTPEETQDRKKSECARLADLLHDKIIKKKDKKPVPPGQLFDLKK